MASAFPRGRCTPVSAVSAGLTIAATAYTSGDHVGGVFQFAVGDTYGPAYGEVCNIFVTDKAASLGACELWLFRNATPTVAADNAALSIADADLPNLVGIWELTKAYTTALNKLITLPNAESEMPFFTGKNGILYGVLVTRTGNAFFGAVNDVTITLIIDPEE
jgi:hypothetical protein